MGVEDIPKRFDDRPEEDVVLTRNFGVCEGVGLMMIKIDQGSDLVGLSCNNADVLKEIKRLLKTLNEKEFEVSDIEINDDGYPQLKVLQE